MDVWWRYRGWWQRVDGGGVECGDAEKIVGGGAAMATTRQI
jgi:hypothetical protein